MAASNCSECIGRVLKSEGGYTDHPSDPGGPTNFGITIHDARKYWKPGATAADIRAMPLTIAREIYKKQYWNALNCDALPPGVDYAVFDYGVNSGIGRSGKVLRRLLGLLDNTHVVTSEVVAAASKAEARDLVTRICGERLRFLKGLRTWPVFGKGWARRVAEVQAAALQMAATISVGQPNRPAAPLSGKVVAPLVKKKQKASAGAVIATGAVAAQQAHATGVRPWIVVLIVLGTVALAITAWCFWRWREHSKQQAAV
jgi:lysozyme family protein